MSSSHLTSKPCRVIKTPVYSMGARSEDNVCALLAKSRQSCFGFEQISSVYYSVRFETRFNKHSDEDFGVWVAIMTVVLGTHVLFNQINSLCSHFAPDFQYHRWIASSLLNAGRFNHFGLFGLEISLDAHEYCSLKKTR